DIHTVIVKLQLFMLHLRLFTDHSFSFYFGIITSCGLRVMANDGLATRHRQLFCSAGTGKVLHAPCADRETIIYPQRASFNVCSAGMCKFVVKRPCRCVLIDIVVWETFLTAKNTKFAKMKRSSCSRRFLRGRPVDLRRELHRRQFGLMD